MLEWHLKSVSQSEGKVTKFSAKRVLMFLKNYKNVLAAAGGSKAAKLQNI